MILIFGGTGYIGSAFVKELIRRGIPYKSVRPYFADEIKTAIDCYQPTFVINAAGFTGSPNVDECEEKRQKAIESNIVLPSVIADICLCADIDFAHVSSGCIYDKIIPQGYAEEDPPNFCFTSPPCSFYSGTKALAEELLKGHNCYIWRLRMPFDEFDHPKNYLTKLLTYEKIYDARNSISHLGECVSACLDLWEQKAPFGIYNVVNKFPIDSRMIVNFLYASGKFPDKTWEFFKDDEEFYKVAKAPRSNCYLRTDKISKHVQLREVGDAVWDAINKWQPSLASKR